MAVPLCAQKMPKDIVRPQGGDVAGVVPPSDFMPLTTGPPTLMLVFPGSAWEKAEEVEEERISIHGCSVVGPCNDCGIVEGGGCAKQGDVSPGSVCRVDGL